MNNAKLIAVIRAEIERQADSGPIYYAPAETDAPSDFNDQIDGYVNMHQIAAAIREWLSAEMAPMIEIKGTEALYRHNYTYMTDDGECGWIGTEKEMDCDFSIGGETWSNWICPKCRAWERLSNYELLSEVRIIIP
jgi:hypothetical protein